MDKSGKARLRDYSILIYKIIRPLFDPVRLIQGIPRYINFFRDLRKYSRMEGAEKIKLRDLHPSIHNKKAQARFDLHYFYQDIWAFKKIRDSRVDYHVDVGSRVDFVGFLSAIIRVEFVDIRPINVQLENFIFKKGSILKLPFDDNSISSISCLHVAEHIGLGRYGDPLDPSGAKEACKELARVVAPGGNLYFSVPVGSPRVCFNAHRIFSPRQILEYFNMLKLTEFSGIDDSGNFKRDIDTALLEDCKYACGLFHFKK